MLKKAIIFAHADGDGHISAVQSRENLPRNYHGSKLVVDPLITKNYKFWEAGFQQFDFEDAELIIIVDIMFSPKDPSSSYAALVSRAESEPDRKFVVIDHHDVKGLPEPPPNLTVTFVDSVYKCCYGKPSDIMLIAAVCDNDEKPVKKYITDGHRKIAKGIKRAVSDREGLAGQPTLELISNRYWAVFEQLAEEPGDYHKTFYGNRTSKTPESPLLQVAHAMRASVC